jgi:hypothetical protein
LKCIRTKQQTHCCLEVHLDEETKSVAGIDT